MKSERRHELKQNELRDTLEQQIIPFFREHGTKVLAGVLVIVLIGFGLTLRYRSNVEADYVAWSQLFAITQGAEGTKPQDLEILAQQSGDRDFTALALKGYADALMFQVLTGDAGDPVTTMDEARSTYQRLIDEFPDDKIVSAAARLGMGIIYENLAIMNRDQGKWDQARQIYQDLADDATLEGLPQPDEAAQRLAKLDGWRKLAGNIAAMPVKAEKSEAPKED